MSAINRLSVARLQRLFVAGELSAVEIVDVFLERIDKVDPQVQAFVTVTAEQARERARKLDNRRQADPADDIGALAAVPVAIKDNICTQGVKTTASSRMLQDFVPPYDATAVQRLYGTGAILLGKTNLDELAMGSTTETSALGPTRNPWDLNRVPGGSSGGSAAAVAAEMVPLALATDTGGSIRQPAAYCGIVGLKPTYGAVSRYGAMAVGSSLDHVGVMSRDVNDCALALGVMAGQDRRDSTSSPEADRMLLGLPERLQQGVKGMRIGVPKELMGQGIDAQVRQLITKAVAELESQGAKVAECSLPSLEYALNTYTIISAAEASANLARLDGVRYGLQAPDAESIQDLYMSSRAAGFGAEVKRRILLGTYFLSAGQYERYYQKAMQARTLIIRDFERILKKFDALATPTTPTAAFNLGSRTQDPLAISAGNMCVVPANLAGLPAITVPCGLTEGLPVGLQLIGKPFAEPTLLQIAAAYERSTTHHQLRPSALAG